MLVRRLLALVDLLSRDCLLVLRRSADRRVWELDDRPLVGRRDTAVVAALLAVDCLAMGQLALAQLLDRLSLVLAFLAFLVLDGGFAASIWCYMTFLRGFDRLDVL